MHFAINNCVVAAFYFLNAVEKHMTLLFYRPTRSVFSLLLLAEQMIKLGLPNADVLEGLKQRHIYYKKFIGSKFTTNLNCKVSSINFITNFVTNNTNNRHFSNSNLTRTIKKFRIIFKKNLAQRKENDIRSGKYLSFLKVNFFLFSVESFQFSKFYKTRRTMANATIREI